MEKHSAGNKPLPAKSLAWDSGGFSPPPRVRCGEEKSGITGWMLQLPIRNLPLSLLLSVPRFFPWAGMPREVVESLETSKKCVDVALAPGDVVLW